MSKYEKVQTPWGKSQYGELLFKEVLPNGKEETIIQYGTASHGGLKLTRKLNSLIPASLRRSSGWYEEDCDSAIVFYYHNGLIRHFIENNPSASTEYLKPHLNSDIFEKSLKRWKGIIN